MRLWLFSSALTIAVLEGLPKGPVSGNQPANLTKLPPLRTSSRTVEDVRSRRHGPRICLLFNAGLYSQSRRRCQPCDFYEYALLSVQPQLCSRPHEQEKDEGLVQDYCRSYLSIPSSCSTLGNTEKLQLSSCHAETQPASTVIEDNETQPPTPVPADQRPSNRSRSPCHMPNHSAVVPSNYPDERRLRSRPGHRCTGQRLR